MEINDSFFIEVLESLEKHKVNYLLVGGMAVAYYGYHHYTGDMDLWLEPTSKNLEKLYLALGEDLK
jgi:predicted nucleotidyltransferase